MGSGESEFLRAFREVAEEANRAWNEGDFKRAYGFLPQDFEYQLGPAWPEAGGLLRGSDEVVAFFEALADTFPDIQSGPTLEFIEAGAGKMIVGFTVVGTGRSSGTPTEMEVWQLWEVGEGMIPIRVVEFMNRQDAVEAAGVAEPEGRED